MIKVISPVILYVMIASIAGLSIVKAIAKAHNGQVSVNVINPTLFEMTITLRRS